MVAMPDEVAELMSGDETPQVLRDYLVSEPGNWERVETGDDAEPFVWCFTEEYGAELAMTPPSPSVMVTPTDVRVADWLGDKLGYWLH